MHKKFMAGMPRAMSFTCLVKRTQLIECCHSFHLFEESVEVWVNDSDPLPET